MGSVLRAAFGYCFLVFMVRVVGRRPGKQMTPFDFIFVFFVGGLSLTAMVGDDRSLVNALTVITSIAATHFVLVALKQRHDTVGRLMDGTPLMLFNRGEWQDAALSRALIPREDVLAAMRGEGLRNIEEVEYAVLERNGDISIIKRTEQD